MQDPDPQDAWAELHGQFRWQVPAWFNLAEACCGRWARQTPQAVAIRTETPQGRPRLTRFAELQDQANRLSRLLRRLGVRRGDRVAVVMPQRVETAVAHIATYQLGAVAMPLSQLFGPEALAYRLQDSGARVAIGDDSTLAALRAVRAECPGLQHLVAVGAAQSGEVDWVAALAREQADFTAARTRADEAAVLIYTSGTTGPPKGALIPHRALIGDLSGFVCSQNLLMGTHSFLFPTALKALMKACPEPARQHRLHLRAIMSAGEAVGDTVFHWCRQALDVTVNEMFGQTEINYIVGNCSQTLGADGRPAAGWPARPGSMGRAYPGHRVAVIDDDGQECPRGVPGDVAVHRRDVHGHPDPVFFLGYWKREDATRAKYTGDPGDSWCRTGDTAVMDEEGYLWYQGRSDDVFKAAGYRIGPSEVENCLVRHPAVANAAVVPKPDPDRGAVVKAYVVLAPGHRGDQALVDALQQHVSGLLAPYEYPKEIEFIEALPMTTTGKVQRRGLRLQEEARQQARQVARPG